VTIAVLAGDTDPNGDPLGVVGVDNPAHGTVHVNNDGTVTYTPQPGFSGPDTFSYTVGDGNGGTDTATVTVTVANAAPAAVADARVVEVDTAIHIPVLGNDTDPNPADDLRIAAFDAVTTAGGTVALDDRGTPLDTTDDRLLYTPPAGYLGADTFTYDAGDGTDTATATVSIAVANTPPVAAPEAGTTDTNTPVTLAVLGNDTDPSGDALTVTGFTNGGAGTVQVNNDGTVTYTPDVIFSGSDIFTYTVGDGRGGFDTTTVIVTVLNATPVAAADAFTVRPGVARQLPVLLNDHDPNNHQLSVMTISTPGKGVATQHPNGSVTYTAPAASTGTDSFTYTISDSNGGTATGTVTVTIDEVPVAVDDTATTPTNTAKIIDVLGNDTDPEAGALTVSGHTQPDHGGTLVNGDQTITYTPDDGFFGADTFTYTAEDPQGGTSTATVTVTVTNAAPTAVTDVASTGGGEAVDIDVLANDTDPNTGQTLAADTAGTAAHGTVDVLGGGIVRYTPDAAHKGPDTFTYTLGDGHGGTDTGTVNVTVSDLAPVAVADSQTTTHHVPVTVTVLGNDTDANGDPLTVTAVTVPQDANGVARGTAAIDAGGHAVTYSPPLHFAGTVTFGYTVSGGGGTDTATVTVTVANAAPVAVTDDPGVAAGTATDIDVLANDTDVNTGQTLTVTAVGQPLHGTVTLDGDGTVRYQPVAGYKGADSFTYTVSDGHGGTDTGTVTVTVSDAAPVASADTGSTPYQQPVVIAVLGNDVDPNGDALTVTGTTDPVDAGGVQRGTVSIGGNSTLTYQPADGFSGVVTFTYTVDDSDGGTDTALVTVTVGLAPAVPDESAEAAPGKPVTIPVPTVDEHGHPVTISAVADPAHGTAQLVDGEIVYTPDPGFHGTDSFQYTVVDQWGNTASAFITVTVAAPTQVPPVAKKDVATTKAGTPVVITVLTGDTDADGDSLTVLSVTQPPHGSVLINVNGTVVYTPDAGFSGTDTFTYTVSDGHGHTASAPVTVTVAKAAAVVVTPVTAPDTDEPAPAKLPKTGTDVVSMAAAGLAAVIVGAVLVGYGVRAGQPVLVIGGGGGHRRAEQLVHRVTGRPGRRRR
jgi:LPXTG-motif cell wall-anchored protein